MDTSNFLKRALLLQNELQQKRYPNSFSLAELCGCSRSTAMRTIERLQYEFGVPIEYDQTKRGYFLTNPDYSFTTLPPGRDELVAAILLSEMASLIADSALKVAVTGLWSRITNGRADVRWDLEQLRAHFTSDTTSVAKLADIDVMRLLNYSHVGQCVKVRYRSPWGKDEDREHFGRFERFHFSDGILYSMFLDHRGRQTVMNVSFIREITEIETLPQLPEQKRPPTSTNSFWLEGYGVWAGAEPITIQVTIASPASRYYAAQTWHPDQEDSWEGGALTRRFRAIPSPELHRRILSLGRYVTNVQPDAILHDMTADATHLAALCARSRRDR